LGRPRLFQLFLSLFHQAVARLNPISPRKGLAFKQQDMSGWIVSSDVAYIVIAPVSIWAGCADTAVAVGGS